MARVYMADGNYVKAQALAENALTLAKAQTGSNSVEERSKCLIDLAFLYKNQGKFAEAQKVCEKGLELQKQIYYKDHPYIASTLRILSSIYLGQEKYIEAQEILAEAIEIMRKSHLPDDPALASFQVDMARILAAQGKLDEAEAIYLPAIKIIDESYGNDHLYTAGVLGSLAELYTLQARYDEAEKIIDKTLKIQEEAYGRQSAHSQKWVAGISSWLTKAEICQAKKDYDQSENLLKTALDTAEKYLGASHPTTIRIQSRLAQLYTMREQENNQEISTEVAKL